MTKRERQHRPHERRYWLVKSEASVFSIDDLANSPKRTTSWDGVRNYQARNFMREMTIGDRVLFYHSNADPPAIVGVAEVAKTVYADPTQFDNKNAHYDAGSHPDDPRWEMVDIKFVRKLPQPLTLDRLRKETVLKGMVLLQKGSRLSVQPVRQKEWEHIVHLSETEP